MRAEAALYSHLLPSWSQLRRLQLTLGSMGRLDVLKTLSALTGLEQLCLVFNRSARCVVSLAVLPRALRELKLLGCELGAPPRAPHQPEVLQALQTPAAR